MTITTRHASAEFASRLELDHNGVIAKQSPCARQIGTTVTLTNLFSTLPVRKREFQKNIKKEFAKMCQILQGYCLVTTGVRVLCTNHSKKGTKSVLMSTNGTDSVLDNISAIFGHRQKSDLLQMKPAFLANEKITEELLSQLDPNASLNIDTTELDSMNLNRFKMDGWISSCSQGSGRSSKDRQYIYINSRPCEPKQIIKVINETYHRYNVQQNPFVFLNILIDRCDVDVNLTPDKRQILVNNEKLLLLALRKSLINTFADIPSTFKLQNIELTQPRLQLKQQDQSTEDDTDFEEDLTVSDPKKFSSMLSQWRQTGRTDEPCETIKSKKRKPTSDVQNSVLKMKKIQEYLSTTCDSVEDVEENIAQYNEADTENSPKVFYIFC